MKKIQLLLKYYKSIAVIPILATLFFSFQFKNLGISFLIAALFSKLFILIVIWFIEWINNKKKENLYFYFNNGITQIQLYTFTFLIDCLILFLLTFVILWIL
jgi:hypothetical protein